MLEGRKSSFSRFAEEILAQLKDSSTSKGQDGWLLLRKPAFQILHVDGVRHTEYQERSSVFRVLSVLRLYACLDLPAASHDTNFEPLVAEDFLLSLQTFEFHGHF